MFQHTLDKGQYCGKLIYLHSTGNKYLDCECKDDKLIKINSLYDSKGRNCLLDEGNITVWKLCKVGGIQYVYVKLSIPYSAKRVNPINVRKFRSYYDSFSYKSRVEYAKVELIVDINGKEYQECHSFMGKGKQLVYKLNETVYPDGFNDNINNEDGQGIYVQKFQDQCDQWRT